MFRSWWLLFYVGGLVLLSHMGSFGGEHFISFGWDFLVIALFSGIILKLALYCRLKSLAAAQSSINFVSETKN